jgi:hypothetical protein
VTPFIDTLPITVRNSGYPFRDLSPLISHRLGLGSNTCIQDAHNLAWKIAYVEKGTKERENLNLKIRELTCDLQASLAKNSWQVTTPNGNP